MPPVCLRPAHFLGPLNQRNKNILFCSDFTEIFVYNYRIPTTENSGFVTDSFEYTHELKREERCSKNIVLLSWKRIHMESESDFWVCLCWCIGKERAFSYHWENHAVSYQLIIEDLSFKRNFIDLCVFAVVLGINFMLVKIFDIKVFQSFFFKTIFGLFFRWIRNSF